MNYVQRMEREPSLNQAFKKGMFAEILTQTMIGCFLLSFFPFIDTFAYWLCFLAWLTVPFLCLFWSVQYQFNRRNNNGQDSDLTEGRYPTFVAFGMWLVFTAIWYMVVQAFS